MFVCRIGLLRANVIAPSHAPRFLSNVRSVEDETVLSELRSVATLTYVSCRTKRDNAGCLSASRRPR